MKKRIIIVNSIIVSLALIFTFIICILAANNSIFSQAQSNVVFVTETCANSYDELKSSNIIIKDDSYRETIIDKNGKVIEDSKETDVSQMANHLSREEIQAALLGEPKIIMRDSETIGQTYLYYAIKVNTSTSYVFIRVALTVSAIRAFTYASMPLIVVVLLLAILFVILASFFVTKNTLKPITVIRDQLNGIVLGRPTNATLTTKDKDVVLIMDDINVIENKLQNNIVSMTTQKEKLEYIINNISDGIVVLDSHFVINSINKSAYKIFEINNLVGKNLSYLTLDEKLIKKIQDSTKEDNNQFEYLIVSTFYYVNVSRIDDLFLLVFTDINNEKRNQEIREEFFRSASHELKTPLTSIIGYGQLIASCTEDKDIKDYSLEIEKNSRRMLTLILDMMSISELDSRKEIKKEIVDLNDTAKEAVNSLKQLIKGGLTSVFVIGDAKINGIKDDFIRLFKNLIENSIKYNDKTKKEINVDISEDKTFVTLSIKDNGIGIKKEDQSRIFERFFTVDKSRSKELGGTGLGLAIVKHIVEYYQGTIEVNSKIGLGTEMIFKLKK